MYATYVIACLVDDKLIGLVKDAVPTVVLDNEDQPEYPTYIRHLTAFAHLSFGAKPTLFQLRDKIPFFRCNYHDWDLARPANHEEPVYSESEEEDGSEGEPQDLSDPSVLAAALREIQENQTNPAAQKAKLLAALQETMSQTKSRVVTRTNTDGPGGTATSSADNGPATFSSIPVNTRKTKANSGGSGGGGGGAGPSGGGGGSGPPAGAGPAHHGSQFSRYSYGGGGGGGGGHGPPDDGSSDDDSDHDRRRRKKKKRSSKKRSRSSDSSDEDDDVWFACKSKVCTEKFRSKPELNHHLKECPLFYGEATPVSWGKCGPDMEKYNVKYYPKKYQAFEDDNLNALHPARWRSYPANHAQACAAQPLVADPPRHNFPWEIYGVSWVCVQLITCTLLGLFRFRWPTSTWWLISTTSSLSSTPSPCSQMRTWLVPTLSPPPSPPRGSRTRLPRN